MNNVRLEMALRFFASSYTCIVLFSAVCVSQLYAMVSETLRYKPLLDRLVLKADPR